MSDTGTPLDCALARAVWSRQARQLANARRRLFWSRVRWTVFTSVTVTVVLVAGPALIHDESEPRLVPVQTVEKP